MPNQDPPDPEIVARLSMSITRLARVLRQQEPIRSRPAAAAALGTIVTQGPISLGDLAAAERVSPSNCRRRSSSVAAVPPPTSGR